MSKKYSIAKRIYGLKKYSLEKIILEDVTKIRVSHDYEDIKDLVKAITKIKKVKDTTVLLGKLDSVSVKSTFDEWVKNQKLGLSKTKIEALRSILNGWAKTNTAANEIGGPFIELLMTELTKNDVKHIASLKSFEEFNGFPSSPFWDQLHDIQRSRIGKCELSLCLLMSGATVGDDTGAKKDSKGSTLEKIVSDVVIRKVKQNCNPKIGSSALGSNDPKKVEKIYSDLFKSFHDKSKPLQKIFPTDNKFPFSFSQHEVYAGYRPRLIDTFIEAVEKRIQEIFPKSKASDAKSAAKEIAGLITHCMCIAQTNEFSAKGGSTTSYVLIGKDPKSLSKKNMVKIVPGKYSVAVKGFNGTRVEFDTKSLKHSGSKWIKLLNDLSPGDGSKFSLAKLKTLKKLK